MASLQLTILRNGIGNMILVYGDLLLPRRGRPLRLGLRLVQRQVLRSRLHPAPAHRWFGWRCPTMVWWPQHLLLYKQNQHLACSCTKQLLMQQHLRLFKLIRLLNRFYIRLHIRFLRLLR